MSVRSYFIFTFSSLGLIACFTTAVQSRAKSEQQVWQEYAYKDYGFFVSAPKAPVEKDLEYFKTFEFSLDPDLDLVLEVSKPKRDCAQFEYWAKQHGSSRYRILTIVAGHTTLEQWAQYGTKRLFTRAVCIDSTMYTFAGNWKTNAVGPEIDEPRPEIISRIMDSFRVVKKEKAGGE